MAGAPLDPCRHPDTFSPFSEGGSSRLCPTDNSFLLLLSLPCPMSSSSPGLSLFSSSTGHPLGVFQGQSAVCSLLPFHLPLPRSPLSGAAHSIAPTGGTRRSHGSRHPSCSFLNPSMASAPSHQPRRHPKAELESHISSQRLCDGPWLAAFTANLPSFPTVSLLDIVSQVISCLWF